MTTKVLHLRPGPSGKWAIWIDGDFNLLAEFPNKIEALEYGRLSAKWYGPSRLVVYDADGTVDQTLEFLESLALWSGPNF
jgi:hypothetical protein